jgi:hypothetical protein
MLPFSDSRFLLRPKPRDASRAPSQEASLVQSRGTVRSVLPLGVSLVAMKRTRLMRKRLHHKRLLQGNNCHLCIRDGRRRTGYARQSPKIGRQSSCNFVETAQPNL